MLTDVQRVVKIIETPGRSVRYSADVCIYLIVRAVASTDVMLVCILEKSGVEIIGHISLYFEM